MGWDGTLTNAYKLLDVKPEVKRQLGRPRHRRDDDIKMDSKETVSDITDGINLAQGRNQRRVFVNTVTNIRGVYGGGMNVTIF